MIILAGIKTVFSGLGWLLLAGFLLLMGGLVGQYFIGQNSLLEKTGYWLLHEKKVLTEIGQKPRILPPVHNLFEQQASSSWQRFVNTQALTTWQSPKNSNNKIPANGLTNSRQRLFMTKEIFCNLLEVIWLRYNVVLLFLPLFGLLGFVGLVDGLTQRHLRKRQGARESSVLYHHAKISLKPSLFGAGVVYVGMPVCFNPVPLFFMFALLFSVVLAIAARTYKKYI